jgi:hypothetical protein
MRRAYYRKKLEREAAEPKEPVMPYLIRGRAVEAAIAGMLFGNATTMERHKRYEKRRIACYADLSDSKRIIEIKDKNTGRTLCPVPFIQIFSSLKCPPRWTVEYFGCWSPFACN